MLLAKLASFYGWSIEYIESMPHGEVVEYYEAITVLEAQDRLVEMNISDYPKMSKENRRKYFRSMKKLAHPAHLQKTVDFADFIKKVSNG